MAIARRLLVDCARFGPSIESEANPVPVGQACRAIVRASAARELRRLAAPAESNNGSISPNEP
jgi:hypothetical protein